MCQCANSAQSEELLPMWVFVYPKEIPHFVRDDRSVGNKEGAASLIEMTVLKIACSGSPPLPFNETQLSFRMYPPSGGGMRNLTSNRKIIELMCMIPDTIKI